MAFLRDGYQTTITFLAFSGLLLKEREVQPPDLDGGGEIDTTTMRQVQWRTKWPRSLKTLGDMTLHCQYDPAVYRQICGTLAVGVGGFALIAGLAAAAVTGVGLINVNTQITVTFPDGSQLVFLGWIDKFTPTSNKEGDFPLAEVKIHASNQNNAGLVVNPIFNLAGTAATPITTAIP